MVLINRILPNPPALKTHPSDLHCEPKKTQQHVFDIQSTKPDRLWQNLVHIVLSKFVLHKCKCFLPHPKSVSTLPCETYSIRVLHVNSSWNCEPKKHTKLLLSYLSQNEADSDKVWYVLSWLNLP